MQAPSTEELLQLLDTAKPKEEKETPSDVVKKSKSDNDESGVVDNIRDVPRSSITVGRPERKRLLSPASHRFGYSKPRLSSVISSPTPFRSSTASTSRKESSSIPTNLKQAKPAINEKRASLMESRRNSSLPKNGPLFVLKPINRESQNKEYDSAEVKYKIPINKSQLTEDTTVSSIEDKDLIVLSKVNTDSDLRTISLDYEADDILPSSIENGSDRANQFDIPVKNKPTNDDLVIKKPSIHTDQISHSNNNADGSRKGSTTYHNVTRIPAKDKFHSVIEEPTINTNHVSQNNNNTDEQVTWASLKNNKTNRRGYLTEHTGQEGNINGSLAQDRTNYNKISNTTLDEKLNRFRRAEFPQLINEIPSNEINLQLNNQNVKNTSEIHATVNRDSTRVSESIKQRLSELYKQGKGAPQNTDLTESNVQKSATVQESVKNEMNTQNTKKTPDTFSSISKNMKEDRRMNTVEKKEIRDNNMRSSESFKNAIKYPVPYSLKNVKPKVDDKGSLLPSNLNLPMIAETPPKSHEKPKTGPKVRPGQATTIARSVKPVPAINVNQILEENIVATNNEMTMRQITRDSPKNIKNQLRGNVISNQALKATSKNSETPQSATKPNNNSVSTVKTNPNIKAKTKPEHSTTEENKNTYKFTTTSAVLQSNQPNKLSNNKSITNPSNKSKNQNFKISNISTPNSANADKITSDHLSKESNVPVLSDKSYVKAHYQDGATATEPFVTVFNNSEIIHLQLNLEVKNNEGTVTAKINSHKSRSDTNLKKALADEVMGHSKSMDSLELPSHICCQRSHKSHSYQCPCCDHSTHEDTCLIKAKIINQDTKTYYLLVPVTADDVGQRLNDHVSVDQAPNQYDRCFCNEEEQPDKKNRNSIDKEVQHSASLLKSNTVIMDEKETLTTSIEGVDKSLSCHIETSKTSIISQVVAKRVSISRDTEEAQSTISSLLVSSRNDNITSTISTKQDKSVQTDMCNLIMEVRRHEDGRYSFHLPPLAAIKHL